MKHWPLRGLLLGCVLALPSPAQDASDNLTTFIFGRIKYSQNDGNDCGGVGQDLIKLVARASTLKVQQEKRLRLTDPELFETPFVFMNGHNDFVLTEVELEALRKYLSHGGFFFASGCCTNPNFPKAWRREFSRLFANETVKTLPYDHPSIVRSTPSVAFAACTRAGTSSWKDFSFKATSWGFCARMACAAPSA